MKLAAKDITEKVLEDCEDVFADIVNVLLFNGEQLVKPEALENATLWSLYKVQGKIRWQERDLAKFWRVGGVRAAVLAFENQTDTDADISLRVIGYDGADYRGQVVKDSGKKKKEKSKDGKNHRSSPPRLPVVTLVLYFGKEPWIHPNPLCKRLQILDCLKPHVLDYPVHVFDISALDEEQVKMFKSDFGILADYLVQMRKYNTYTPSDREITHVEELMNTFAVLTDDKMFKTILAEEKKKKKKKGGIKNMSDFWMRVEARGMARGVKKTRVESISSLMKKLGCSAEHAMDLLDVPVKDRRECQALLNRNGRGRR